MPLSNSGAPSSEMWKERSASRTQPSSPYAQQSVLLIQKQGTVPRVGAEAVRELECRLQSLILLKRGGVRLRFC